MTLGARDGPRTPGLLSLYDIQGRLVAALPPQDGGAFTWDGRDARGRALPAGVYLYRLSPSGERGSVVRVR